MENPVQVASTVPQFSQDYFSYIYLPIGIWLFIVTVLVIILIIKYTFGSWTKENPNPYDSETLGLPRGTLRGILTLTLLYVVILFETFSVFHGRNEQNYAELLVAFKMMIAFYFGSKVAHHVTSTERAKSEEHTKAVVEKEKAKTQTFSTTSTPDVSTDTTSTTTTTPSPDEIKNDDESVG